MILHKNKKFGIWGYAIVGKAIAQKCIYYFIIATYTSFSIAAEEKVLLNEDLVRTIIGFCDIPSINSLLQSCKTIHNYYAIWKEPVTEDTTNRIHFGINRVIMQDPPSCTTLSDDNYLKGLILYANDKDTNKGSHLFHTLLHNGSTSQKARHNALMSCFQKNESIDDITIYRGLCGVTSPYIVASIDPYNTQNPPYDPLQLPFIFSIYHTSNGLSRHTHGYKGYKNTNMWVLFGIAVVHDLFELTQKLLNTSNDKGLVNNAIIKGDDNCFTLLSHIIEQKKTDFFNLFLTCHTINQKTYHSALKTACEQKNFNSINSLLQYGIQHNLHDYLDILIFNSTNDFNLINLFFVTLGNDYIKKYGSEIIFYVMRDHLKHPELCIAILNELFITYDVSINSWCNWENKLKSLLQHTIDLLLSSSVQASDTTVLQFLLSQENIDINTAGCLDSSKTVLKQALTGYHSRPKTAHADQLLSEILLLFLNHKDIDLMLHKEAFKEALTFDINDDVRQHILNVFPEMNMVIEEEAKPVIEEVKSIEKVMSIKEMIEEVKSMTEEVKSIIEKSKSMTEVSMSMTEELKSMTEKSKSIIEKVKPTTQEAQPVIEEVKPITDNTIVLQNITRVGLFGLYIISSYIGHFYENIINSSFPLFEIAHFGFYTLCFYFLYCSLKIKYFGEKNVTTQK